ncbi:MAG: trypsin-like serine protease [Deltaproteobacteria bacterium]|nr:trypsin-like serine protease [Deltaproteobacteria bacterium]
MPSSLRVVMLAAALVAVGCVDDGLLTGSKEQPIIGGAETAEFPAVALIEIGAARCTATLITDTVMLTAAHCVYDQWAAGRSDGQAFFGPSRSEGDIVEIDDIIPHYLYRPKFIREADIGLVRLAEPPPGDIQPMAWNRDAIDIAVVGQSVDLVGFGVTDGEAQTGAGVKREVAVTIDEIREQLIGIGGETQNICQGDSGGPAFLDIDGVPTLIAVSSFGSNFCMNRSFSTRSDVFADFVEEVAQAWSGPCQNDFQCQTEGCGAFPDPDCGVCGLEGVCGQDCPSRDLDCPHKGVPGDVCDSDDDCELGMCVPSEDNENLRICSEPCDPTGDGSECWGRPSGGSLDTCVDRDGEGVCMFTGIVPGTQGAPCEEPADCISGICDARHEICVETCEDGCADPFSCEKLSGLEVCTFAEGGCCSMQPGRRPAVPSGTTAGLTVLVMLFLWWRRRRNLR